MKRFRTGDEAGIMISSNKMQQEKFSDESSLPTKTLHGKLLPRENKRDWVTSLALCCHSRLGWERASAPDNMAIARYRRRGEFEAVGSTHVNLRIAGRERLKHICPTLRERS
ncbi:MAG: hypothetical protein ONB48_14860 [candidate division KSB1 bacterium]|nr:hypothetical protein [candidate division KSB1 bacterium]MDZ7273481.1 hypothetical protein [candidate division KSB1 bacterium]MDZ7286927.1 hypothetical protein [candidate division KSB1 bacterium]MDZ7299720.1 hypothetical protein [candidate division KSB1 bacterium]MDZ7305659.1 hypothetical protein [candidate division KSB1 bacterium]